MPPVLNILGSGIYMALISVIAKKALGHESDL